MSNFRINELTNLLAYEHTSTRANDLMKKTIISLLLLLVVKASIAQISYGVKGGLNFSNIYSTKLNTDFKQGYHVGAYAKFNLIILAVQPELLFSQRGYKESNVKDVTLNYIDIPVMLKLKIFPMITLDAGPQFSYLINESIEGIGNILTVQPDFKKSELSGAFGASAQVWRLGASARYIVGFSELEKLTTSKNQQFQVSLSLKL